MKILRISTRIFPDIGGPAKQTYLLSKYFSEKNIDVSSITSKPKYYSKKIKREEIDNNFNIYYLPIQAPGHNSGIFKKIIFSLIFFITGFYKIFKIKRKNNIDLIHAHTPPPAGFLAWVVFKLFKIPYLYSIHGLDFLYSFILKLNINIVARNAKTTIVVSRKIEDFLIQKFGINNTYWLPNGIDTSNYYHIKSEKEKNNLILKLKLSSIIEKDDFIVCYIGYMIFHQKVIGMIDFLEAFSNFLIKIQSIEKKKKIKLIYIGDGDFSYLLTNKIRELNLNKNVSLLGKRNDVKDILAISDLLALTSYTEGFPNVILEGMASKVPCLGSDVGEIKFIIKDTGFIVKSGDIENITKNLEHFYNMKKLERLELMKKAKQRVRNLFDIQILGEKLLDLIFKKKLKS